MIDKSTKVKLIYRKVQKYGKYQVEKLIKKSWSLKFSSVQNLKLYFAKHKSTRSTESAKVKNKKLKFDWVEYKTENVLLQSTKSTESAKLKNNETEICLSRVQKLECYLAKYQKYPKHRHFKFNHVKSYFFEREYVFSVLWHCCKGPSNCRAIN